MTADYNRPRKRIRSFSAGVLSGTAISQGDVMGMVQENIQFRLSSLRDMLMSAGEADSMSPIERRKELMARRREVLGETRLPVGDEDDDSSSNTSSSTSSRGGSGRIGDSGSSRRTSRSSSSHESSTPSMSEVDTGTKERAAERGFED